METGGVCYQGVKVVDISDILKALGGNPIERLLCPGAATFFHRQSRIVTDNCGRIDPERIEEYIGEEGYEGLYLALTQMTRQGVIDQITLSGLRGRGGAGFPTGLKWTTVAKATDSVNRRRHWLRRSPSGNSYPSLPCR